MLAVAGCGDDVQTTLEDAEMRQRALELLDLLAGALEVSLGVLRDARPAGARR